MRFLLSMFLNSSFDIFSIPPAMIILLPPFLIISFALIIACKPELQRRFIVYKGTFSGIPLNFWATRELMKPHPPWRTLPIIISSIKEGFILVFLIK